MNVTPALRELELAASGRRARTRSDPAPPAVGRPLRPSGGLHYGEQLHAVAAWSAAARPRLRVDRLTFDRGGNLRDHPVVEAQIGSLLHSAGALPGQG